ncbi:MAG: NTP transferase domain-containing protein [Deltaproteobacteria bacterium]|nr:NTP transferase domain-containing protein [Deltaproteobacteria bacterium]
MSNDAPSSASSDISSGIWAGIFVGGASRRMGGHAKGLLRVPGTNERILERLVRLTREQGLTPVLVGDARPYRQLSLGVSALTDAEGFRGPLAGLAALLDAAGSKGTLAVACDMPFVNAEALERLSTFAPRAAVVAPRRGPDAPWEPLFARYSAPAVRPILRAAAADGVRSFQGLFKRVGPTELPLDAEVKAALEDWDSPADLHG